MDLRAQSFRCFLTLAEECSFTRAATRLGLTQSALSMRIRDMEQQLDVTLFHRSSRSVTLTGEGAELLDQAARIVAEADRFHALVDRLRRGSPVPITVAMPASALGSQVWMNLLDAFAALEPLVELRIIRRTSPEVLTAVKQGDADVGFVAGRPDTELPLLVVATQEVRLALPNEWPLAAQRSVRPQDIAGMRIVQFDRSVSPGLFDETLAKLAAAGAELVPAKEGIIGAGFAARARLANLSFAADRSRDSVDRMTSLPVESPPLAVRMCMVRSPTASRQSVRRLWELASRWSGQAGDA